MVTIGVLIMFFGAASADTDPFDIPLIIMIIGLLITRIGIKIDRRRYNYDGQNQI